MVKSYTLLYGLKEKTFKVERIGHIQDVGVVFVLVEMLQDSQLYSRIS